MRLSCSWLPANRDWELSADVGLAGAGPSRPLVRVYWRLFKPQFSLDGLANWAGMTLQEARPKGRARSRGAQGSTESPTGRQERGLTDAALGGSKDLAEMPIRVAGTEWDEWDECDRIKPNQGQSSRIKVNQGKSSQIKPAGVGGRVESGQWTVVSGQWLVAKA